MTVSQLKQEGQYLGFIQQYGFIYKTATTIVALRNGEITPYTGRLIF